MKRVALYFTIVFDTPDLQSYSLLNHYRVFVSTESSTAIWPNGLIITSSRKLNLHRCLQCVAQGLCKFLRQFTQVEKNQFYSGISCALLANDRSSSFDLGWVVKRWKSCVYLRAIWYRPKWVQVIPMQVHLTPGQMESYVSRPKISTYVSVFASLFGQGFKAMDDAAGWVEVLCVSSVVK